MGLDIQVGTELEFYLLDPETGQPRDTGNDCYGLVRAAELEPVLGPIREQIGSMGSRSNSQTRNMPPARSR